MLNNLNSLQQGEGGFEAVQEESVSGMRIIIKLTEDLSND
jgi:hypothetical protein